MSSAFRPVNDSDTAVTEQLRQIRCECGHTIFDGVMIRSRALRLRPADGSFDAKCRCKRWLRLPVKYAMP